MKQCLADVNVLLALLVVHHQHHRLAFKWFEGLAAGHVGLCRIVQLALIRLLGNPSIMGSHAMPAIAAFEAIQMLLEDERVQFIIEPPEIDYHFPKLLLYPTPTGKLVTDAYLAAFAIGSSRQLVTLDRGFRQFKGLDCKILG